ncbi:helix-turn-helix transcriptional regulator [Stenotrophomonas sp.]|uniref:AraC family transcriptional regulator n=1 Tax=Stenotrophomonas sp. TaxID=69392 RepID=UPI00289C7DCC|nr:helix-turn-helix transcriptional regulator [Stenotrophomonas sp.]
MSIRRQSRDRAATPAGRELTVPPLRALPWPVVTHSREMAVGERFPPHVHAWHQLAFATDGVLQVTAANARHVITPQQALWVPGGTLHHTRALSAAAFRNLYVGGDIAAGMPTQCTVLEVSALLRALIIELDGIRADDDPGYYASLCAVIATQLQRQPRHARHLPWPQDARLQRWCQALYDHPDDDRDMSAWATQLGASARTLARRFERETGMTVRGWRTRLRLLRAMEWLVQGRSPTVIAHNLGYASASAFNYMFRVEMGVSPLQWRRSR